MEGVFEVVFALLLDGWELRENLRGNDMYILCLIDPINRSEFVCTSGSKW